MSFLDSLSMYTASQKLVAYGFITSGVLLLLSVLIISIVSPDGPLWQGFRIGAIIFGLAILAGGIGYLSFSNKVQDKVAQEYTAGEQSALSAEVERMDKVSSDYPLYQKVFAGIVLLALVAILFASPFWAGFAYPVAFLFVAILLIEAHSKVSIDAHTHLVQEQMKSLQ